MQPRRTATVVVALGLGAALLWWAADDSPQAAPSPAVALAAPSEPVAPMADSAKPAAPRHADKAAARALWEQRLQRARHTLDSYRLATRYPHESRPLAEHPDQVRPFEPVVNERPLRVAGGATVDGLNLRTTQERVYSAGDESVLFTVAAVDGEGRIVPMQVPRAMAHEGATGLKPSRVAPVSIQFTDDGRGGDATAGDGVLSFRLQPARDGFAELDGVIRVELALQAGDQPGYAFFDVIHSPGAPAVWGGVVREAVEKGSLNLYLPVQIQQAGRYVVSGRIDDANGRPVALVNFNEELGVGPGEFRLQLFGKLLRDMQPAFPLALRDVEAFLLKPDAFPDRALMPRRVGLVHRTQDYPLVAFSNAEWTSEERSRYLAEYTKDVREAEDQLNNLGSGP
ncbi:hypothetical protein AACH06_25185 [Ideonella sp. DXS29W]|uniref:DUF748 domain-containing protein n=1 Tax=Ideonella lacteola TaxID=2984193 RepID=A0ABU9BVY6_9BURK